MDFQAKMDDSKIVVNLDKTNLKDILVYCKPKERLVLVKKFGLAGEGWIPLQRIWKEYNLTRERIRQIESQALMRFRRLVVNNPTYIRVLEEAKSILDINWWFLEEDDLVAKLVNKNVFKFSKQELKLILISDFDIMYLKRNVHINKGFYLDNLYEDVLTRLAITVKNHFEESDKSKDVYEFIAYLKDTFYKEYPNIKYLWEDSFYLNFFKAIRWFCMFDGKVWLPAFEDVNPRTIKLKVLHVLRKLERPCHFQELHTKVAEYFDGLPVKVNTIHNELVKNNDVFVNMGLGLYGLKERGYEWGQVVDILQRILKKHKRPMKVKELSKEVLKEKMVSPNTVMINLQKYKDIFERVDKWTYTLKKK